MAWRFREEGLAENRIGTGSKGVLFSCWVTGVEGGKGEVKLYNMDLRGVLWGRPYGFRLQVTGCIIARYLRYIYI